MTIGWMDLLNCIIADIKQPFNSYGDEISPFMFLIIFPYFQTYISIFMNSKSDSLDIWPWNKSLCLSFILVTILVVFSE